MMTEAERSEFRRRMEAQNEADRAEFRRRIDAPTSSASSFHPAGSDSGPRGAFRDLYGIEARARSEWERSAALREEFTSLEAYTAFRKAEARGLVRIFSRKA